MIGYRGIAEAVDRWQASPAFLAAFNVAWIALLAWSLNASNLLISVLTANVVLLTAATVRATNCATQAKLDELIAAIRGARETLIHAEQLDEAAIAEVRR